MDLKQGDTVVVDGKTSNIETSWGQGKHRAFKLRDGRTVLDLDKLVESGKAQLTNSVVRTEPHAIVDEPKKKWLA